MQLKPNSDISVNIVVIVVFIILTGNFIRQSYNYPSAEDESWSTSLDSFVNELPPIDSLPPEELPHNQYKKKLHDMKFLRELKNGTRITGGTILYSFLGTYTASYCDTCSNLIYYDTPRGIKQNYVALPGWGLKHSGIYGRLTDSIIFHVEHGQPFLRKNVVVKKHAMKKGNMRYYLKMVDVPVKFKYNNEFILIPVSEQTMTFSKYTISIAAILYFVYAFYLIAVFMKLIIDISKGLTFTTKNIKRLRLIALSLLLYPVVVLIFNLLLGLVFSSYFTADVVFKMEIVNNFWVYLLLGVTFLLFYKAFRQGRFLKEEADLTV